MSQSGSLYAWDITEGYGRDNLIFHTATSWFFLDFYEDWIDKQGSKTSASLISAP